MAKKSAQQVIEETGNMIGDEIRKAGKEVRKAGDRVAKAIEDGVDKKKR